MKTKHKILLAAATLALVILDVWAICELGGSDHYNYQGYVVDVAYENGETVITTISGNLNSRFKLKWYTKIEGDDGKREISEGDLIKLTTTAYSSENLKKIYVGEGYSTEGKLVYVKELPNCPFILWTEPTTGEKYLFSVVHTDDDFFGAMETGEPVKIYYSHPISFYTVTVAADAWTRTSDDADKGLTEDEVSFVEKKGYTVVQ